MTVALQVVAAGGPDATIRYFMQADYYDHFKNNEKVDAPAR